jgi:hypothetical protein
MPGGGVAIGATCSCGCGCMLVALIEPDVSVICRY